MSKTILDGFFPSDDLKSSNEDEQDQSTEIDENTFTFNTCRKCHNVILCPCGRCHAKCNEICSIETPRASSQRMRCDQWQQAN